MSMLQHGYSVTYASEENTELSYYIQCLHYLQVFLFELFLHKISFGLPPKQRSSINEVVPALETIIDYSSSWTDDSSSCGDTSDEPSLISSYSCSNTMETVYGADTFMNDSHFSDEGETECEIEFHAEMIIQRYLMSQDNNNS